MSGSAQTTELWVKACQRSDGWKSLSGVQGQSPSGESWKSVPQKMKHTHLEMKARQKF